METKQSRANDRALVSDTHPGDYPIKKMIAAFTTLWMAVNGYCQGTLIFNNRDIWDGIDARVYSFDGVTGVGSIAGMKAQLVIIGPGGSLTPITPSTTFRTLPATAQFYVFDPGLLTVPGIPSGASVTLRMMVFNGADFNSSVLRGQSDPFTIVLGGPGNPAPLVGLTSFVLQIPEPSMIALGSLGLGALLLKHRR